MSPRPWAWKTKGRVLNSPFIVRVCAQENETGPSRCKRRPLQAVSFFLALLSQFRVTVTWCDIACFLLVQSPSTSPKQVTVVSSAMGNGKERRIEAEVEHTQSIVLASGSTSLKHKKPPHLQHRPESPSSIQSSGSTSGMFQKMTKSLGSMKETVVKFAKNDL